MTRGGSDVGDGTAAAAVVAAVVGVGPPATTLVLAIKTVLSLLCPLNGSKRPV